MPNIYDLVTAKELAAYYNTLAGGREPYLGETLFPADKQLGLDLSWIKGAGGLPAVLKPAAFDTKAVLRDRVGFDRVEAEMPFFKEAMLIKERDRQELNKVMQAGNSGVTDIILNRIFGDEMTLVEGARAQRERMIMQLLATGRIVISAAGAPLFYDYHMNAEHTGDASAPWNDPDDADPVYDVMRWLDIIDGDTGVRPTRAICTRKTWAGLLRCKAIKLDVNAIYGDSAMLMDSVLHQYLEARLGIKVQVYNKRFVDEDGAKKAFFPDDTFTLIPDGFLGKSWFGTTPEESDLLNCPTANVSIVDKGVAITASRQTDPVNVETKVTMINLPSFERIDEMFIASVGD